MDALGRAEESPRQTAQAYLDSGEYLRNAGRRKEGRGHARRLRVVGTRRRLRRARPAARPARWAILNTGEPVAQSPWCPAHPGKTVLKVWACGGCRTSAN